MPELIMEHEQISLYYHPEHGIVHHQVHSRPGGQPFRDALTRGAEIMETRGATKWLSDDRNYFVLPPEEEEWGKNVWFPRVKAAGWTYWAVVRPQKAIGELNVSRFIKLYGELGITTNLVSDFDEAWAWLIAAG